MRIAIVESEKALANEMTRALTSEGDTCHVFEDAKDFLHALPRDSFDACILDRSTPGLDSVGLFRVLRERRQHLPTLVLTDQGSELDLINVLDSHSHDFQVKPVRPGELRARITALVRRAAPGSTSDDSFSYDRFEFNLKTLEVRDGGVTIDLTQKEFQLAMLLMSNIGKPLSRAHIREAIWGRNSEIPSRTLDTHISRVRSKLSLRPETGYLLAPVYSYGYRLENLQIGESRESRYPTSRRPIQSSTTAACE